MIVGAYLDCSRNAVMKPSEVKKYVEYLSAFGYQELYLYMEDTYEMAGEPYFGRLRAKYTAKELKELDDYCYARGIELIPAIQVLGHMGTSYRWAHFEDIIDTDDILLVGEEKTYAFLDKAFACLRSIFRTDRVHIGMDEAHNVGKGKYLARYGYEKPHVILRKHLEIVSALLDKYGYTGMMWSDLFFKFANDEKYSSEGLDEKLFAEATAKIPDNIEVFYWWYYSHDQKEYDDMLSLHKKYFRKANFAGGACSWQGFAPLNEMSLNVSKVALRSCIAQGVDRAIVTLWQDGGGQCSFYSVLPCVAAWAEFANGNFDLEKIKRQFEKVVGEDWDTMMLLNLPNHVAEERLTAEDRVEMKPKNPSLYMLYNDYFCGAFDCFVKEGDGARFADYAKRLAAHGEGKFGYLFDTLTKLCEVLELKYDLGVKTRRIYQAKDKKGLQALVEKEYTLLPERIERFLESYLAAWDRENKTSGAEVEDIRLGGLIQRTKHCKAILQKVIAEDFIVEELEEPILNYAGSGAPTGTPVSNNRYLHQATCNVLSHDVIY